METDGKQLGILSKFDALGKARGLGLDLVEIAPNAKPPVAKIIDFKKFLYQEEKKKKEEKKKSKTSETKELRLGPFMNEHDLMVVLKKAREFLEGGNKVKFVVKFAGRQITQNLTCCASRQKSCYPALRAIRYHEFPAHHRD